MSERNQCQGCQAGWPINSHGKHKVVGGYPGEVCGCTRERYADEDAPDQTALEARGQQRLDGLET